MVIGGIHQPSRKMGDRLMARRRLRKSRTAPRRDVGPVAP